MPHVLTGNGRAYFYETATNGARKYRGSGYTCSGCQQLCSEWEAPPRRDAEGNWWCPSCIAKGEYLVTGGGSRTPAKLAVPLGYTHAELHQLAPQQVKLLSQWPKKTTLLLLGGDHGRGKTHAFWALCKTLAREGLWIVAEDGRELRQKFSQTLPDARRSLVERLLRTRFLAIDDLFAQSATQGWNDFVELLIDRRLTETKPTLLTCHTSPTALGSYGTALQSRLHRFVSVLFAGPDRRNS